MNNMEFEKSQIILPCPSDCSNSHCSQFHLQNRIVLAILTPSLELFLAECNFPRQSFSWDMYRCVFQSRFCSNDELHCMDRWPCSQAGNSSRISQGVVEISIAPHDDSCCKDTEPHRRYRYTFFLMSYNPKILTTIRWTRYFSDVVQF